MRSGTLDYAEQKMLPLFVKHCPGDERPARAIAAARELDDNPVAQAVARAIGQSAGSIHAATHSVPI
jgi:hypothetical protein